LVAVALAARTAALWVPPQEEAMVVTVFWQLLHQPAVVVVVSVKVIPLLSG
jgi:hypothetical protein